MEQKQDGSTRQRRRDDRLQRLLHCTELMHAQWASYHSHKELVAHAVIAAEVAMAGFLIVSPLPPVWYVEAYRNSLQEQMRPLLEAVGIGALILALIGVVGLHWYLLWTFRMRRISGVYVDRTRGLIGKWIVTPPSDADLEMVEPSSNTSNEASASCLFDLIEKWVFPLGKVMPKGSLDRDRMKLPKGLDALFQGAEKVGPVEKLFSGASLLLCSLAALALGVQAMLFAR